MSRTSRIALILFILFVNSFYSYDTEDLITLLFRVVCMFVFGIMFIQDDKGAGKGDQSNNQEK